MFGFIQKVSFKKCVSKCLGFVVYIFIMVLVKKLTLNKRNFTKEHKMWDLSNWETWNVQSWKHRGFQDIGTADLYFSLSLSLHGSGARPAVYPFWPPSWGLPSSSLILPTTGTPLWNPPGSLRSTQILSFPQHFVWSLPARSTHLCWTLLAFNFLYYCCLKYALSLF